MVLAMEKRTVSRELFEKEALPLLDELFASAMRLTKKREAAEDLISEVYERAWKSFHQFEPGTNLRAWLYRILMNVTIDSLRRKQIEGGTEFDDEIGLQNIAPGAATAPKAAITVKNVRIT